MIAYARGGVDWPLVGFVCVLAAMLMALVATWPAIAWPLQGVTLGLLAATAARGLDEPLAAVVDTAPRTLRWRTGVRSVALGALALTWAACIVVSGERLPPHSRLFLVQGAAALLFAAAWVTWRRARGEASPGERFASAVVPVAAVLALLRPFPERLPLFPVWPGERFALSLVLWSTLALASVTALTATLANR